MRDRDRATPPDDGTGGVRVSPKPAREEPPLEVVRARLAALHCLLDRLLHDLKQPLNLITVSAQDVRIDVAKGRFDHGSLSETMSGIENAVRDAVARIDRIRALGASTATGSPPPEADVNEACLSAVSRMRRADPAAAIVESPTPGLARVPVDPIDLEQAIWEVLDNAVRANGEAGREGRAVLVSTFARGDDVVVAIRDRGRGVPEEGRSRVFEPFHSTREGRPGLGLPLAVALVREAGGRIGLEESGEDGALFEITLPARG